MAEEEAALEQIVGQPPAPGDLFAIPDAPGREVVSWLIVHARPDDRSWLFVVPVDTFPLVGMCDIRLDKANVARCAEGAWVSQGACQRRVGVVPGSVLSNVKSLVSELARGKFHYSSEQEETECDPEYQEWMDLVQQSREALTLREARTADPLGCRERLRAALAALAQPNLEEFDGPRAGTAAQELAIALGRCRLFAIEPWPELDGTLTVPMALAAAKALAQAVAEWSADARSLRWRWDEAEDSVEAESLCVDVLEARMDAWAGFIAIDEALPSSASAPHEVFEGLNDLLGALKKFDRALTQAQELLAPVVARPILENWRRLLAAKFRKPLPWWLDGC